MKDLPINQLKGTEKILLVDDEKPILNMFDQLLKRFGYNVQPYHTSLDALSCFESSPYEFDIVITDMNMPGITGDKLVTKIKTIRPELPVILCTGSSEKIVDGRINGSKPNIVLMKPSGTDEILRSIRMLLDK